MSVMLPSCFARLRLSTHISPRSAIKRIQRRLNATRSTINSSPYGRTPPPTPFRVYSVAIFFFPSL